MTYTSRWSRLKIEKNMKIKHAIDDEIEKLEVEIADLQGEKYAEVVKNHLENMSSFDGSFSRNKMWSLKKKIMP